MSYVQATCFIDCNNFVDYANANLYKILAPTLKRTNDHQIKIKLLVNVHAEYTSCNETLVWNVSLFFSQHVCESVLYLTDDCSTILSTTTTVDPSSHSGFNKVVVLDLYSY